MFRRLSRHPFAFCRVVVDVAPAVNACTASKSRLLSTSVKKVGIVGGGVAGLQTAKVLAGYGFECTIFDKCSQVGGVWQSNYSSFALQVPKQLFEFPDFPFPVPSGYFPKGPEVQKYIEDYAAHHKLNPLVKLNTIVERCEQLPQQAGWAITTKSVTGQQPSQTESFDYLVVSTGMYSKPNLPTFGGDGGGNGQALAAFQGKVVHSTEYTDNQQGKGEHVVVIGGAKSAIDLVLETSKVSKRSTIVYTQSHWGSPTKIAGLIPFQYVFLSRLGQALVSWYKGAWPGAPASVHSAHSVLRRVMGPIFGIVEALFAFQLNRYGAYKPRDDVVKDFYGYGHVLDSSFKRALDNKSIDVKCGKVVKLEGNKATLDDGSEVPCSLVICATGYDKTYDYFDDATRQALGVEDDGLYLYRHCLPPNVPNLAFIGSEIATISNIVTHGLQAEWVARILKGQVQLPPPGAMAADVERMKAWKRSWMPWTKSRASLVLLHQIHYHDILLNDMGVSHRRKGANVVGELLLPYEAGDYDGIMNQALR